MVVSESPVGRTTGTEDVVKGSEAQADGCQTGATLRLLPTPVSLFPRPPNTLWRCPGCFVPSFEGSREQNLRQSEPWGRDLGELGILEFCFPTQPGFQKVSHRGCL